jgi:hypothetical protein
MGWSHFETEIDSSITLVIPTIAQTPFANDRGAGERAAEGLRRNQHFRCAGKTGKE